MNRRMTDFHKTNQVHKKYRFQRNCLFVTWRRLRKTIHYLSACLSKCPSLWWGQLELKWKMNGFVSSHILLVSTYKEISWVCTTSAFVNVTWLVELPGNEG